MKKYFMTLAAVLCCAMTTTVFTSCGDDEEEDTNPNSPFVGVWQQAFPLSEDQLVLTPNGKVFLPDGRILGYHLNPVDYENYEKFDFKIWFISDYQITSDSTYTEKVTLHENPEWVGPIDFHYQLLNSRMLGAYYEHTSPDGSKTTIVDTWVKVVYDKKELEAVLKKVSDNYDTYIEKAKRKFGSN